MEAKKNVKASLIAIALTLCTAANAEVAQGRPNVPEFSPAFANQTRAPELAEAVALKTSVIAGGLDRPWGVEVLPGGGYLVTERPGSLRVIRPGQAMVSVRGLPKVAYAGQGGLLDVALAPDFAQSRKIFLSYSKPIGNNAVTAVAAAVLSADMTRLISLSDIFIQTPAMRGGRHFGSRVVPDGDVIYITTGDRGAQTPAQDLRGTAGKVLRIYPDGSVPNDNPMVGQNDVDAAIYSYGHRNVQGADLNPGTGELWTLEHGPAGGDELNRIKPGANYGWPVVSYGENYNGSPVGTGKTSADGVEEPRYYWDPVIAPSGFAFYEGDLFDWQGDVIAASLNPGGIVRLKLNGAQVAGEARYLGDLGRVRDVEIDRDGAILLLTDDGRLLRVTPG
ncbi:MAG: PQQ-dependent sugar dehydrogenase [Silicimonas sp.]|nr:PQQ-dependent sugar dehydrogenase [Silicimonas sp.]